ncbi:MAG: hypothetical protein R6U70_02055, partial [Bacillota bacterium]
LLPLAKMSVALHLFDVLLHLGNGLRVTHGQDIGIIWEAVTATTYLQAGADILTMCHPEAIAQVQEYIEQMQGD